MSAVFARWLLPALVAFTASAFAHKGSDAYLDVQQAAAAPAAGQAAGVRDLSLTYSVAIRDMDLVVAVDADADGKVTWGEIKAAMPQVLALLDATVQLSGGAPGGPSGTSATSGVAGADPCRLHWQEAGLETRGDGNYLRATSTARCPADQPLVLHYSLLRAQDATHRLLVAGRIGGADLLSTLSPVDGRLQLKAADGAGASALPAGAASSAAASRAGGVGAGAGASSVSSVSSSSAGSPGLAALAAYFSLGLHHLLQGYDHLAFLLALALPLQLSLWQARPAPGALQPAGTLRHTWLQLLRTVTAFTIGHSLTLMLATFGLTQASPAWVEPAIAASIGFTAWLNIRPVRWIRVDVLALLFGLVHGFGFAGLLLEAAAPGGLLPWALAGFNLGVEAGQLIAVAGWVVLSQFAVRQRWYQPVFVRGGSVLLIGLAAWWFWLRVR